MIYQNVYKNQILLFIILSCISFFISIFSIIRINENIEKQKDIDNIIVLSEKVRYYDEVLTMSSRIALYDNTLYWTDRYYKNVKKLDKIIAQIEKQMPIVKDKLKEVEEANIKLVEFEEKALRLAINKKHLEAKDFLFSKEYIEAKNLYSSSLEEALSLLNNEANKIEKDFDENITIFSTVIIFFIILIFLFSYYIFKHLIFNNDKLEKEVKEQVSNIRKKDLILIEQSKLASLGEMLENIAHQWRQPLAIIGTSVSGMKLKKSFNELDDEIIDYSLDKISKAVSHLNSTIDVFREFYKSDEKKDFSLDNMLKKTQSLLSSRLNEKDIVLDIKFKDYIILGRENELVQVIMNILNNSIDELEKIKNNKKLIKIETTNDEKYIYLNIFDNAGGIPNSIIEKIFDYKFSTKKEKDGTGIGLYMSKTIMEKLKGSISAKNHEFEYKGIKYKGACFIIKIKK